MHLVGLCCIHLLFLLVQHAWLSSWLAPGLFLQGYHYLTSHSPLSDFKPKPYKSLLNFVFPYPTTFPIFQNFDFYPILKMSLSSLSSTAPSASLGDTALHHPSGSWFYGECEISFYYVKRTTYILASFAPRPTVFLYLVLTQCHSKMTITLIFILGRS